MNTRNFLREFLLPNLKSPSTGVQFYGPGSGLNPSDRVYHIDSGRLARLQKRGRVACYTCGKEILQDDWVVLKQGNRIGKVRHLDCAARVGLVNLPNPEFKAIRKLKRNGKGWLCVSKPGNMKKMKSMGIYGVSKRDARTLNLVEPGDDLFVFAPGDVGKVVGLCKVQSRLFQVSRQDPYHYPYRIRVKFVWDAAKHLELGVTLPWRIGDDMRVEPNFSLRALFQLAPSAHSQLLSEIYRSR